MEVSRQFSWPGDSDACISYLSPPTSCRVVSEVFRDQSGGDVNIMVPNTMRKQPMISQIQEDKA